MTPDEINKINLKNNKHYTSKQTKYCPQCNRVREVLYNINKCPVCKTQLQNCVTKNNVSSQPTPTPQPKCPTCGSTNIQKISDLRRGVHAVAWGLLSKTARSQFECKNCGYKW